MLIIFITKIINNMTCNVMLLSCISLRFVRKKIMWNKSVGLCSYIVTLCCFVEHCNQLDKRNIEAYFRWGFLWWVLFGRSSVWWLLIQSTVSRWTLIHSCRHHTFIVLTQGRLANLSIHMIVNGWRAVILTNIWNVNVLRVLLSE